MNHYFLSSLSRAINQFLKLDPGSPKRLKKLKNKTIKVELLPFQFHLFCHFSDKGVKIQTTTEKETEATITGTPWQLFNVIITKENRQKFFVDEIKITGNADFADEVMRLFDQITIDWENELSHFVGDVPAYHVSKMLGKIGHWLQQTGQTLAQDVDEYIHEEALWLPQKEKLDSFLKEIDELRMKTDLIEARINQFLIMYRLNKEEKS